MGTLDQAAGRQEKQENRFAQELARLGECGAKMRSEGPGRMAPPGNRKRVNSPKLKAARDGEPRRDNGKAELADKKPAHHIAGDESNREPDAYRAVREAGAFCRLQRRAFQDG